MTGGLLRSSSAEWRDWTADRPDGCEEHHPSIPPRPFSISAPPRPTCPTPHPDRHTGRPAAPSVHYCIGPPASINQSAKRTPKRCPNDWPAPKKRLLDRAECSIHFLWGRLPSGMTAGQPIPASDRSGTLTFWGYEYHPWNIVKAARFQRLDVV